MSRKMNRRGSFDRKRRFDDDDVAGDFFDRKRRHDDDDVEDKLDDIIKLLKKIVKELDDIGDELDDNDNHGHGKNGCNGGNDVGGGGNNHCHGKCNCCKKKDEECECDAVLLRIAAGGNPNRFGEILNSETSNDNFGCDLRARREDPTPPREGASGAEAIACLLCKGFKVESVTEGQGNSIIVLLTRKRCNNNKCND